VGRVGLGARLEERVGRAGVGGWLDVLAGCRR
jgi:hypothetical protein